MYDLSLVYFSITLEFLYTVLAIVTHIGFHLSTVGHCHPQVVAAGKNQMATLVTAQGFINDSLTKYVKELTSHLPDTLNVVYLVNSG